MGHKGLYCVPSNWDASAHTSWFHGYSIPAFGIFILFFVSFFLCLLSPLLNSIALCPLPTSTLSAILGRDTVAYLWIATALLKSVARS